VRNRSSTERVRLVEDLYEVARPDLQVE